MELDWIVVVIRASKASVGILKHGSIVEAGSMKCNQELQS